MSVVTWLVPTIIFGILIAIIYGKNKDYIDRTIETIVNAMASRKKQGVKPDDDFESILTYR